MATVLKATTDDSINTGVYIEVDAVTIEWDEEGAIIKAWSNHCPVYTVKTGPVGKDEMIRVKMDPPCLVALSQIQRKGGTNKHRERE